MTSDESLQNNFRETLIADFSSKVLAKFPKIKKGRLKISEPLLRHDFEAYFYYVVLKISFKTKITPD